MDPSVDVKVSHTPIICGGSLANWNRRTRIINYCASVLDASYEEAKHIADKADGADPRVRRKAQAELYSADIKVGAVLLFRLILQSYALCLSMFSVPNSTMSTLSRESFERDQSAV